MTPSLTLLALSLVAAQTQTATPDTLPPPGISAEADSVQRVSGRSVVATLAVESPTIDGLDGDAVWRVAPVISEFLQWRPTEGEAPRFRTEARIAYDPQNLYVLVRAFDPSPDSIRHLLERRDSFTPSDMIWVFVDSFHDRRTGYEFGVNAAGVKMDLAVYDDGREDDAWDGVWDVATRTDSLGWVAEFRLPLSQMHYRRSASNTFGIMLGRDVNRHSERYSWPLLRQSVTGFISQFGELQGLDGLAPPRRMEAVPYAVARNATTIAGHGFERASAMELGGDVRYRLASNITLDATVNPDFGQVEADPAVLNLTAYESFFDERRPFFVAGRGLFRFDVNCSQVNCNGEGLYYSRRIGRTPELAGFFGDTVPHSPTAIAGAAKLLGRFPGGLTIGVLNATTLRAANAGDTTFSPTTNFALARVTQDFRDGGSTIGGIVTAVNRNLDSWTAPHLASSAYAAAVDFRHRFADETYEIGGSLDRSRISGSPEAIGALQRNAVHRFQRPDGSTPYDPERTVLEGDAEEFRVGKVGGQHLLFESALQRRSPGFEVNDLGFLRRADQVSWSTWMGLFDRRETRYYDRIQLNTNWWQYWTTDGLPLERAFNSNFHITFPNNWGWHMGGTAGRLGETYDDRAARGGPAVRQDPFVNGWIYIEGDGRGTVVPGVEVGRHRGSRGHSTGWWVNPQVDFKFSGRFSSRLSGSWEENVSADQWYGNFDREGVERYTFARLDQSTAAVTARLNYTFTPDVSLQAYLQPFVSRGRYSDVRALSETPRAAEREARFVPYDDPAVASEPGGFRYRQFRSNLVFRWEYRPGSTLFVVWNQGREGNAPHLDGVGLRDEVNDLFALHPSNTFLVKMSYWFTR